MKQIIDDLVKAWGTFSEETKDFLSSLITIKEREKFNFQKLIEEAKEFKRLKIE